jgi:hypothetical protein
VGDEALRLPLFTADDGDIAFHGTAVDVHFERVTRFASSDHRGPRRVSVEVGRVNGLSDLSLRDRNSRSLFPTFAQRSACQVAPSARPRPFGAGTSSLTFAVPGDGVEVSPAFGGGDGGGRVTASPRRIAVWVAGTMAARDSMSRAQLKRVSVGDVPGSAKRTDLRR